MSSLTNRIAWTTRNLVELRARQRIPVGLADRFDDWTLLSDAIYLRQERHLLVCLSALESITFLDDGLPDNSHLSDQSLVDFLVGLELPIRVCVYRSEQTELRGWLIDARSGLLILGPIGRVAPVGIPVATVVAMELLGLARAVDNSTPPSQQSDFLGETISAFD